MNRFLTPLLLLAITIYVAWYNTNHADRQMIVPGIDLLAPSAAGDPLMLGIRSAQLLFGLAVLAGIWALFGVIRDRSRKREE